MGQKTKFIAALLAAFVHAGCGGGGGGVGGGDELEYVGNTAPATITAADATRLVANIFGAGDLTEGLPTAARSSTPKLVAVSEELLRTTNRAISEREFCYPVGATEPSGFASVSGSINDQTGTGTLTVEYNSCQQGDTFLDGIMTWRVDDAFVGGGMWEPRDSTLTFQTITVIAPELNFVLGGTLRDRFNNDGSETLTLNIVAKDNDTLRMQKTENVVMVLSHPGGSILSETINGLFYDSVDGYLDATTPQALLYDTPDAFYPSSGRLRLTGAASARLRVTALSSTMALIELDLDDNTLFETTGQIPWEVIAQAGQDPNDADGDGLPDGWEAAHGLSNTTYADASADGDSDGLGSYEEYLHGTDPNGSDSDSDGMPDGWEVGYGFSPTAGGDAALDGDGDGATNVQEYSYGTDPTNGLSTPADLAVTKSVSLATVSAQTLLEYTLRVINLGPGLARGVRLTDTLPPGAEVYTVVPGQLPSPWDCILGASSLVCEPFFGTLAAGEEVTIVVPVIAPAALGSATNHAVVESSTLDFTSANDAAAAQATVVEPLMTQADVAVDGVGGVDGLNYPFKSAVSPDGNHLYVTGIYDDALAVFDRDLVTGALTYVEAQREGLDTPGQVDFPKAVAVSPDGKHVYVTSEWSNGEWIGAVVAYSRNPITGALTYVAEYRDGLDGVEGIASAFAVTVSGDGQNVYVAGPGDNAVAVFDRDPVTGQLTYNSMVADGVGGVDGLGTVLDVALSPDDAYLYVAGSSIVVFGRAVGGSLSFVGTTAGVSGLQALSVSNDGKHLYAVAAVPSGLTAFARDLGTGALTHRATYSNGENGVVSLDGMWGLAVAPDGKYVYVAANYDSSLGVFARDADTGALRPIEVQKDGVGGIEELGGAWSVVVSPDSAFVYISAASDNALVALRADMNEPR